MYEGYAGLIFDMDGTILDTEPTHRQAWNEVLGRYGMRFDEQAMVALNGSPPANRPCDYRTQPKPIRSTSPGAGKTQSRQSDAAGQRTPVAAD